MNKHLPPVNAESKPFWDGCAAGELRLQHCVTCDRWQYYPRLACTTCGSRDLVWRAASGAGSVQTFTVVRRAVSAAYEPDVPYVVALVQLVEGPTMMSNIVQCPVEEVTIGMAVNVTFANWSEDICVPLFRRPR